MRRRQPVGARLLARGKAAFAVMPVIRARIEGGRGRRGAELAPVLLRGALRHLVQPLCVQLGEGRGMVGIFLGQHVMRGLRDGRDRMPLGVRPDLAMARIDRGMAFSASWTARCISGMARLVVSVWNPSTSSDLAMPIAFQSMSTCASRRAGSAGRRSATASSIPPCSEATTAVARAAALHARLAQRARDDRFGIHPGHAGLLSQGDGPL